MSAYGMNHFFGANVKACKKCGDLKSLDAFPKVPKARDGRGGTCYACCYASKAKLIDDDKRAKAAARVRAWKQRNPDKVKARRNVDKERDHEFRGRISIDQWRAKLAQYRAERDAARAIANLEAATAKAAERANARALAKTVSAMDADVLFDMSRYLSSYYDVKLVGNAIGAYVYIITVEHIIRYVGKGTGTRAWDHISNAIRSNRNAELGMSVSPNDMYRNLCDSIRRRSNVCVHIVRDGMGDRDAYNLEWRLIGALRPMGILWNNSNGTRR